MVGTPAQEKSKTAEVVEEPKPFDDASQEAVVGVFQKLFDEDPDNAVKTMRENLAEAAEEKRITPEFQKMLNEILDDVEKSKPDEQAQKFKDAVENSPKLKDELANVLLLKDAAQDSASSLLESGGPFAVLFAVLSLVSGGNLDVMKTMNGIAEQLGVDMKPMQDALAPKEEAPEKPTPVTGEKTPEEKPSEAVAQNGSQEQPSEEEPAKDYQQGVNGGALTMVTEVPSYGQPNIDFEGSGVFAQDTPLVGVFAANHSPMDDQVASVDARVDHDGLNVSVGDVDPEMGATNESTFNLTA